MDEIFGKIFNAATGVWALVCMVAVAIFKAWPAIMGRINEGRRDRVAEEAGDWGRLREENVRLHLLLDQRDQRIAVLLEQNFELQGRAVIAEAQIVARDKVERKATILPAAEGVVDAATKRDGNGGGK